MFTVLVLSAVCSSYASRDLRETHSRQILQATQNYNGIYSIGDSITTGYNADRASCTNSDQFRNSWATSGPWDINVGAPYTCGTSEAVYSYTERALCSSTTLTEVRNVAMFGATMVADSLNQAIAVTNAVSSRQNVRNKVLFWLGANDYCSGNQAKFSATNCGGDTNRDPKLYCSMKTTVFEDKLRAAMDQLMTVQNLNIVLASPLRVGQLCNFANMASSSTFLGSRVKCSSLWNLASSTLFGGNKICAPLTAAGGTASTSCNSTRLQDSYTILNSYRAIIKKVATDYATIGATKNNVVTYSDTPWYSYVKQATDSSATNAWVSWCDCFHPSMGGQSGIAQYIFNGLSCSSSSPCCKDPGGSVSIAQAGLCNWKTTLNSTTTFPAA